MASCSKTAVRSWLPYPHATFLTTYLETDDEPITFADASSHSPEPYRRATITSIGRLTSQSLSTASSALSHSLPVAFPTETVYGLAANALCASACKAIFDAKGRPQDNPLIVHVSDLQMAQGIIRTGWTESSVYRALMKRFWPGGITFLVPAAHDSVRNGINVEQASYSDNAHRSSLLVGNGSTPLPLVVTANHPLVGIRMPSHPLARALIAQSGLPLAAPSANASGRPSPTTAEHVMYDLGGSLDSLTSQTPPVDELQGSNQNGEGRRMGRIPYILNGGPSRQGVESTVVDGITSPDELRILRPGAVGPEEIEACLRDAGLLLDPHDSVEDRSRSNGVGDEKVRLRVYGKDMERQTALELNPTTPGMKYRHYSPTAPLVLFVTVDGGQDRGVVRWEEGLRREIVELDRARKGNDGLASTERPLRVGMMLLVDSPLARSILSRADEQSQKAIQAWVERQRDLCNNEDTTKVQERFSRFSNSTREDVSSSVPAIGSSIGPPFHLSLTTGSSSREEVDDVKDSLSDSQEILIEMYPFSLGTLTTPHLPAQRLFSGLRALDEGPPSHSKGEDDPGRDVPLGGVDLIVVQAVQDQGVGLAVMNRLGKAARETVHVKV